MSGHIGAAVYFPHHMDRLRCGVIYTNEFSAFLKSWWEAGPEHHSARIPSLDFVRCREGARSGESWATLGWVPRRNVPDYEVFAVGVTPLHLPRQSQKGLKWSCLDAVDGKLLVRSG